MAPVSGSGQRDAIGSPRIDLADHHGRRCREVPKIALEGPDSDLARGLFQERHQTVPDIAGRASHGSGKPAYDEDRVRSRQPVDHSQGLDSKTPEMLFPQLAPLPRDHEEWALDGPCLKVACRYEA